MVVVFLILTSPVARSAANVESIIAQVPISDVKQELNGIQREVQGHVFPEPSKSNAIPRRPISSLVSRKFAGRGGSMSAIIDIKGDAQLFPNIRGHVTLNQIVSCTTNNLCLNLNLSCFILLIDWTDEWASHYEWKCHGFASKWLLWNALP